MCRASAGGEAEVSGAVEVVEARAAGGRIQAPERGAPRATDQRRATTDDADVVRLRRATAGAGATLDPAGRIATPAVPRASIVASSSGAIGRA